MKFVHFQDPGNSYSTLMDERKSEFRILRMSYIAPNQTVIHCRNTRKAGILSISSSKTLNPVHTRTNQKPIPEIQETFGQIKHSFIYFRCLYALNSHLCNQKHMKFIPNLHKPCPLSSSQDHPRRIFPEQLQLQNLNQFEPVLASAEFTKNLKFPTFNTNFTHY